MRTKLILSVFGIFAIIGLLLVFQTNPSTQEPEVVVSGTDSWMYEIIEPDSSIDPNNIYTFECEIRVKRPEALTTVCADFGWAVWDLKWGKWDALGGYGEGIYRVNDCEPSCAEGTITATPADVVLTDLTFDGTRYYFNTAKIRFKDKSYDEDVYEFVWDIASFYRESPDMRSPKIYED